MQTRKVTTAAAATDSQNMINAAPVNGLTDTVWGTESLAPRYEPLKSEVQADVCVVGGGLAGLCTAYNLQKQGKDVVLIEARACGAGQSGRFTGQAFSWWDDYLHLMEKEIGAEKTATLAESCLQAVDFLEDIVQSEGIDCDWQRVPLMLFPPDEQPDTLETLDKELQAAQRAGLTGCRWVDLEKKPELGNIGRALEFPASAEFHPLKLVQGIADAFVKKGGRLYEQTAMVAQSLDGSRVETKTPCAYVTAGKVVKATNIPLTANLAIVSRQVGYRFYLMSFEIPKDSVPRVSFVDSGEPHHAVRVVPGDGDTDSLLVAGSGHHIGRNYSDNYWQEIELWARQRWTMAGDVQHKWSAQRYQPAEKLHLIGLNPLDPTGMTYVVTGDSGQPANYAATAAEVVADSILGRPNARGDLFDPNRLPNISDVPGYVEYFSGLAEGYAKLVLPAFGDADKLQPGEGGIFQKGLVKAAVFKDDAGVQHVMSAVCTHLGCQVAFNPNEKTFDCPCHGTQYDSYGRVIQGPAATDLKKLEDPPNPDA